MSSLIAATPPTFRALTILAFWMGFFSISSIDLVASAAFSGALVVG